MIRAIILPLVVLAPRIVGGEPSPSSQDATVLLRIGDATTCTGTLIASNLVLTARHCIRDEAAVEVAIGTDAREAEPIAIGTEVFLPESRADGDDIAIIALDRRIRDITPAIVRTTRPAIGERAIAVGYGENGDGEVPELRKQRTSIRIDALGPAVVEYETSSGSPIRVDLADKMIATGESTCFGDSGGPLFDENGAVIGVTSSGVDDECRDRPSLFVGTFAFDALFTRARAKTTPGRELADNTAGIDGIPPTESDAGGCSTSRTSTGNPAAIAIALAAVFACARRRRAAVALIALAACRPTTTIGDPVAKPSSTKSAELPDEEPVEEETTTGLPGPCFGDKTEDTCLACCNAREPVAVDRYVAAFAKCACDAPGACKDVCATTYCAGLGASPACKSCLEEADACDDVARSSCWDDAKCRPLLDCASESKCGSKSGD